MKNTKAELEDKKVRDPIDYLEPGQFLNKLKTKKKIAVKVQNKVKAADQMVDI